MTCFRLVYDCCMWLAAVSASADVVLTAAGGAGVVLSMTVVTATEEHQRQGVSGSAGLGLQGYFDNRCA